MGKDGRKSLYIDSEGPNEDAVELAFAWLQHLGENNEEKQDALLAVNTKKQLDGVISSVIGDQAAKALEKKNPLKVGPVQVHLMTKRIDATGGGSGPILAIYPDKKLLDKIDSMHNVTDVLTVPWSRSEVDFWIDTWGATELGASSDNDSRSATISNAVVKEAVKTLDLLVNSSTGITHPSDRSKAIEVFKTLYEDGITFDSDEIRAYLVSEKGWNPADADDVKEVAEGVRSEKQFQYERGKLKSDILDQWKDKVNER